MSEVLTPIAEQTVTQAAATPSYALLSRLDLWLRSSPLTAFLVLSAFYGVVVCALSSMKLLWLDELITLHIVRLASASQIWSALSNGADPNPPLTHLLVHFSRAIFGEHEWSLRLPAILGYWIGASSLFALLRRKVPPTWALAGVLMSMSMAAFDYSYESRSYGIFYGFAMLALLCWITSSDTSLSSRTRSAGLLGMTIALAAGITTNYFAVLAFMPIAAGEVAFSVTRAFEAARHSRERIGFLAALKKSIRWPILALLLVAASPLLLFRSMINHSIAQFAPHAWNRVSLDQVADSYTQMVDIILYPLLALFVFAVLVRALSYICSDFGGSLRPRWLETIVRNDTRPALRLPSHEAVAIFFVMAYPFLGYLVASVRGGMLSPRFVIPVCFGFAIAGTVTVFRLFGHLPRAGVALLCLCLAWFVTREAVVGYWYMEQKQCFYKVIHALPEADRSVVKGAPIAIPDPLLALTFQHYAPKQYSFRAVFPIDFAAIRFYRHDDSPEENMWAGRHTLYTLPIIPLAQFQHAAGSYLILASDGNWFINDLEHHRYEVQRLNINTRAGAIGGFTPLAHGTPVFFVSAGDRYSDNVTAIDVAPDPFTLPGNLPSETLSSRN